MIINQTSIETISQSDLDQIPTKLLLRRFGRANDFIELNILDLNGDIILNDNKFTDYTPYINPNDNLVDSIDINYEQVLKDYGFTSGQYTLIFSFQRNALTNGQRRQFFISEISPTSTEIRFDSNTISDSEFEKKVAELVSILNASSFIKDLNIAFGDGITSLITNAEFDSTTGTGLIQLAFTKDNGESVTIKLKDYFIDTANWTIPDDKGPVTVEATVKPRNLLTDGCVVNTSYILQG